MTLHSLADLRRWRAPAALLLAPLAVDALTLLVGAARGASGAELRLLADGALMAGAFVELSLFAPALLVLRRRLALTAAPTLLIGLLSGWLAPVAYMALLTIWRGELLDPLVLRGGDLLLTPATAPLGAFGGLVFWLIAPAPLDQPRGARRAGLAPA